MTDYIAIVEALRNSVRGSIVQIRVRDTMFSCEDLDAALDALLRDARRYRLLKANYLRAGKYAVAQYDDIPAGVKRYLDLSLDEVLDAAMEAK